MHFNEYQERAMKFRLKSADNVYALLGLGGEIGELHSLLAKAIRDNYVPKKEDITKELGDILWFLAALSDDFDIDFDEIAYKNLVKLQDRKNRGKIQGSGDDR